MVDQRYLVLARTDGDGVVTAGLCEGSSSTNQLTAADVSLLGPGTAPAAAAPAAPDAPGVWSTPLS